MYDVQIYMIPFTFTKENTFCISLETHPERWEKMQKRFQQENLEVTRWIASTPNTLTDNFVNYLSPNERACAQSHIRIWKHQVENNLEYVFILEDDACFDKKWREKLADFQINDPLWDLLLLNASELIVPKCKWIEAKEQYLCAGYILSIRGATQLLKQFGGNFASADWMTTRLQQKRHSYCFFPWLIIQEGVDSTLRNESAKQADHNKVLRCLSEIDYDISNYRI